MTRTVGVLRQSFWPEPHRLGDMLGPRPYFGVADSPLDLASQRSNDTLAFFTSRPYLSRLDRFTKERHMGLHIGDIAPNFTQDSTAGRINFYDYLGSSWGVLFSHPADFTPVCTTELGAVAKLKPEFDKRNVKVLGLSVDELSDHEGWSRDIEQTQGAAINFPLVADHDRSVATKYDMIPPAAEDNLTVRSVFIIAPDRRIKLILTYPASTGRNFQEILRVIDSLQLTATRKLATPADWKPGDDCIISTTVGNEEAHKLFPGFREIKPYLRTTPAPA